MYGGRDESIYRPLIIGFVIFVVSVLVIMALVNMSFTSDSSPDSRRTCGKTKKRNKMLLAAPNRLEEAQRVREQQIAEIRARVERDHSARAAAAAAAPPPSHASVAAAGGGGSSSTANRLVVAPAPLRGAGVEPYAPFAASSGSSNARGAQYAGVASSSTRASPLSDFEQKAAPAAAAAQQQGGEQQEDEGGKESVFDTVWGARQSSGAAPLKKAAGAAGGGGGGGDDEDDGLTKFMPNMSDSVDGKDKDTNMALFTPERLQLSNRMSAHTGSGGSGGSGGDVDDFLEKQREVGAGMKKLGRYSQLDQSRVQSIRDQYVADSGSTAEDVVVFNGSDHHYLRA